MHEDAPERPDPTDPRLPPTGFRLAVVPGVNPAKWLRVWEQRLPDVPIVLVPVPAAHAQEAVLAGRADAALLRVPVDRAVLSAIPLYTETTVVVVPADHLVAAADEVTAEDLADDVLLVPADDVLHWPDAPGEPSALAPPASTADAVELVAAGVGVLAVPQSLARLHHRRDLTYRPVTDAPTSSVGLAWPTDEAHELVEELIGIVRGRTANSSRGRAAARGGTGGTGGTAGAASLGTGASGASGTGGGAAGGRGATAGGGGRPTGSRAGSGRAGAGRPTGGGRPGGTRGSGGRGTSGRGRGTGRSR